MSLVADLVATLTLEQIEVNMFRGITPAEDRFRIFGGQVVAQALVAAYKTVEGRVCHSLQSYFIRPGDPSIPVLYQVERSRDGKSFTTRRVIAIQHGEQIFNLACSFQAPEDGVEHQAPMPAAPPPDSLKDEQDGLAARLEGVPAAIQAMVLRERAIEMRPVEIYRPTDRGPPNAQVWFRTRGDVGPDPVMNQAVLAYASDMSLLATSMRPHGIHWVMGDVQAASLDHILWFHRPTRLTDWHLYCQTSPSASGGRGFNFGAIYRQDGTLVASAAQEGLIRLRP